MKYTLLSLVLISIQLSGMMTTDVASQKDDDFYRYVYKKEIARILPLDVCEYIDHLYALLRNDKIRESLIKTTGMSGYQKLFISNNGHYYAYANNYNIELRDIEQSNIIGTFSRGTKKVPIYFSPNNDYCVIKSGGSTHIQLTTYLYNFIQRKKHIITPETHNHCSGITISHDSKYVVYKDENGGSLSHYTPWILDDQGKPQEVTLKSNYLTGSKAIIFHPDNKHIIHNKYQDKLYLYNLETGENNTISPTKNETAYCIDKLTLIPDNKKIMAKTRFSNNKGSDTHHDILFNIENLDNVTSVLIPQQLCDTEKQQPVIAIPYKNMITHISDCGRTLQLLNDETLQCIATHTTQEGVYITALAVDNAGNYLAAGHSDGTIMIWDLFRADPVTYEKTYMQTKNGFIKSLTFSENQLLLSQSQSCDFFDDNEATPTPGTAILWDMYGNEITHFDDNIVASIMSPNGKTIIITSAKLEWFDFGNLALQTPYCQRDLTLTTYHQTDENLTQCSQKGPTLTQLSRLMAEANSDQMDLDAQQQAFLPCNQ